MSRWPRGSSALALLLLLIFVVSSRHVTQPADDSFITVGPEKRSLEGLEHNQQCRRINRQPLHDQCAFAKAYCQDEDEGIISYMHFVYCALPYAKAGAVLILLVWLAILFTTIAMIAGDFFSVSVTTIASTLRMSDTLAGVTILALGNGSPDIFSTFAAVTSDSASMAIGELLGAACFIATVVAGSMALVKPFKIEKYPFLRDVAFLLVSLLCVLGILIQGELQVWHCVVMIGLYIFYVAFVMLYHWWLSHRAQAADNNQAEPLLHRAEGAQVEDNGQLTTSPPLLLRNESPSPATNNGQASAHESDPLIHPNGNADVDHTQTDAAQDSLFKYNTSSISSKLHRRLTYLKRSLSVPREFILRIFTNYYTQRVWHIIATAATLPPYLLLKFTVPVTQSVEDDKYEDHMLEDAMHIEQSQLWNCWLLVTQIFLAPQFVYLTLWLDGDRDTTNLAQTLALICAISTAINIVVILTSGGPEQPRWWPWISVLGFVMSAFWLSTIADEVVAILKAFGVIAGISEAVLGFTVFAVGNSLDDLMANLTVAQHGHPVMAFGACFGGPLLNILLGLGISGLYVTLKNGGKPLDINTSLNLFIIPVALAAAMILLAGVMAWKKWYLSRSIGFGLIAVWVGITAANVVVEVVWP